jgi:hypothetical protein
MQLKKIVDSIIQSHKNEVARDVKILIDRRFAMMSKDILSAISQQSYIPKADSAKKNVDTCIYGSNVGDTVDRQDPCERAELEFLSVGLQHKYPLQQEANLVRPRRKISCWNFNRMILWRHCTMNLLSLARIWKIYQSKCSRKITWCHLLMKLLW